MFRDVPYKVGDTIEYVAFGGEQRVCVVEAKEEDIKNGRPGFDATLVDAKDDPLGGGVWGYDYQVMRVVNRA